MNYKQNNTIRDVWFEFYKQTGNLHTRKKWRNIQNKLTQNVSVCKGYTNAQEVKRHEPVTLLGGTRTANTPVVPAVLAKAGHPAHPGGGRCSSKHRRCYKAAEVWLF